MEEVIRSRMSGGQRQLDEQDIRDNGLRAFSREFRDKRKRDAAPLIVDDSDVLNANIKLMVVANLPMQNKR